MVIDDTQGQEIAKELTEYMAFHHELPKPVKHLLEEKGWVSPETSRETGEAVLEISSHLDRLLEALSL